jgi:hypothetical protein
VRAGQIRYWVNTVSREHVLVGAKGGFTQADHGRQTRLKKLAKGDLLVFYSPRTEFQGGDPLRAFTAIGRIADEEPYQVEMTPGFRPWRRRMRFLQGKEAPIEPLIETLDFIPDKKSWGFPFRRGLFEVGRADFLRIAKAMKATILDEAWHEAHPMPAAASLDERVSWHLAHAQACACRPIPETVLRELEHRGAEPPAPRRK